MTNKPVGHKRRKFRKNQESAHQKLKLQMTRGPEIRRRKLEIKEGEGA